MCVQVTCFEPLAQVWLSQVQSLTAEYNKSSEETVQVALDIIEASQGDQAFDCLGHVLGTATAPGKGLVALTTADFTSGFQFV